MTSLNVQYVIPWHETTKLDSKYKCACTSNKRLNFFTNSSQKAVESCWLLSLERFFCWEFSIQKSGMVRFFSSCPIFGVRSFTFAPDRARKKCVLNTKVHIRSKHNNKHCFLLFITFIFNVFPSKVLAMRLF